MAETNNDEALKEGFTRLGLRRFSEAEALLRPLTENSLYAAKAWHGLSRIHEGRAELEEALACSLRAIQADPDDYRLHYALGIQLQDGGQGDLARASFTKAVSLQPDFFQGWNNLGLALAAQGLYEEACSAYLAAIKANPDYAMAIYNLARALVRMESWEEAFQQMRRALTLDSANPDFHELMGALCLQTRRSKAAAVHLGQAIQLGSRDKDTYARYAQVLHRLGVASQLDESLSRLNEADVLDIMDHTMTFLAMVNQPAQAKRWGRRILARMPEAWKARVTVATILPAILASSAEIDGVRVEYEAELDALQALVDSQTLAVSPEQVLAAVRHSNFYLAYQGRDDRALQEKRARVLEGLLGQALPDLLSPIPPRPRAGRKPIVGFVSAHLCNRTVGHYFRSWVTGLDASRFEVRVYFLDQPATPDSLAQEIAGAAAKTWRAQGSQLEIARHIKEEACDVLIYPEVGMDDATAALALMRLAPIQCVAWGHPITTGFAQQDYFLSCDPMEPEGAQAYYSEKLVTLPGLGVAYRPIAIRVDARRRELGLPEEGALLFYPHSLFKMHPDGDVLIARILAALPQSRLVVFTADNPEVVDACLGRLRQAFLAQGIHDDRIVTLSLVARAKYLEVASVCEVVLDNLHWSGGNTSLDAFTAGTPVVTLPGAFMRGRQTMAMLRLMGLEELIARDGEDYVRIAVKLVQDPAWRAAICEQIRQRREVLFNDSTPIRALENFLETVVP